MCGGGRSPAPAARLPEAPVPPTQLADGSDITTGKKKKAATGGSGTILTGPGGVTTSAATETKTLLGS